MRADRQLWALAKLGTVHKTILKHSLIEGEAKEVGAYATTAKSLDNKICTLKFLLSCRFRRKTGFWTIFSSAPQSPPPPKKNGNSYFYCRLAVSDQGRKKHGNEKCSGRSSGELSGPFCLETPHFHGRCPQIVRNCSRELSLEHCHCHAFFVPNLRRQESECTRTHRHIKTTHRSNNHDTLLSRCRRAGFHGSLKVKDSTDQKPGDHPNFRKNALGVKRPFSELSESSGVFSEQLGIGNSILGIRNSILGMASHDLINTKTTILGATLGAIPGIAANPPERFSFAPAFSERVFKNWGGPRAPEQMTMTIGVGSLF